MTGHAKYLTEDDVLVGEYPAQLRCRRVSSHIQGSDAPRVVLIHGGSHTGDCWLRTPDGRPGWTSQFVTRGYDVYVVDYIDIGVPYPWLERTPDEVLGSLAVLMHDIGPAAVVGHSLGGGLAVKLTEAVPELTEATVLLAPASVEVHNRQVLPARTGEPATLPHDVARQRLANAPQFPSAAAEAWLDSLVPYSPHLRNAGSGATPEFRVDPDAMDMWRHRPVLMVLAEQDCTVPLNVARLTAEAIGVAPTVLGADWGLPGHGHMFIIELGSDVIAHRTIDWLEAAREGRR